MAGSSCPRLVAFALSLQLLGPMPGRAQTPAAEAPMSLTLDDAVARALDRNLDIAVERLNPQMVDLSLAGLRATYRPLLAATVADRSQVNPPSSQLNGGQRVASETLTYNGGVLQQIPWGGRQPWADMEQRPH